MDRITKAILGAVANSINNISGNGRVYEVENGSSYTQWKLTYNKGSIIALRANTKRELYDQMHAFKDGIRSVTQG